MDDDLYKLLEGQARKLSVSFKEVVNDAIRTGLGIGGRVEKPRQHYDIPVFRSGLRPGIDPTKLNQMIDELEVEDFIEKMRREGK